MRKVFVLMMMLSFLVTASFAAKTTAGKTPAKAVIGKKLVKAKAQIFNYPICAFVSTGVNDAGEVYYMKKFYYDCDTGVRIMSWDMITGEVIWYND